MVLVVAPLLKFSYLLFIEEHVCDHICVSVLVLIFAIFKFKNTTNRIFGQKTEIQHGSLLRVVLSGIVLRLSFGANLRLV